MWDSCCEFIEAALLCCRLTSSSSGSPPKARTGSIKSKGSPHDWRVAPLHPSGLAHRGLTLPYLSHVAWTATSQSYICRMTLMPCSCLTLSVGLLPLSLSPSSMTLQIYGYIILCYFIYSSFYITATDHFSSSWKEWFLILSQPPAGSHIMHTSHLWQIRIKSDV